MAKTLNDLGWLANRKTPVVLSVLVFEDLAMAVILPLLGALAIGGTLLSVVAVILTIAANHGDRLSEFFFSSSDEVNLLTARGGDVAGAGAAKQFHVSAAVGGLSRRQLSRRRTTNGSTLDWFT